MRRLFIILPVVLLMAALAACTVSTEDAEDDSVAADATETPVMDTAPTDDEEADDTAVDDATDDAVADDAVDDSVTDDAVDDATDDAVDDEATDDAVDDAADDEATDDAVDDAADDEATDDATDDEATDDAVDDEEVTEPVEHTVEIVDGNEFSPNEITIALGDTVTWVNNTDQVHTSSADPEIATDPDHVELPEGAETWHSGNIEPGEEYSVTFDVPGVYVYFCYPHQDGGMIGTIIVEDPDATEDDDDAAEVEVDDDDDEVTDDPAADDDDDVPDGVGGDREYNGKDSTN